MTSASNDTDRRIREIVDREHARQVAFLSALPRTPSDYPPGDTVPIAPVIADVRRADEDRLLDARPYQEAGCALSDLRAATQIVAISLADFLSAEAAA